MVYIKSYDTPVSFLSLTYTYFTPSFNNTQSLVFSYALSDLFFNINMLQMMPAQNTQHKHQTHAQNTLHT